MATRRKYRYPDRATAEAKLAEVEEEKRITYQTLRHFYLGNVAAEFERGEYRVKVLGHDSHGGPYVLVSWHCSGQSPTVHADDAYTWAGRMRRWYGPQAADDEECRQLVELADEVQRFLNTLWASTMRQSA